MRSPIRNTDGYLQAAVLLRVGVYVQLLPSEASEAQDISWPVSRGSARRRKWKKARAIKWTW